jgi:type I restriction enzyme S subunit
MEYRLLSDITTKIGSGATPKGGNSAYQASGISLIRSQNVLDFKFSKDGLAYINKEQADKLNNVTVQKDDVLLNITGDSIARTCIVPDEILPARVNQHVSIIRSKTGYNPRYIHYYLMYMKPYLLQICGVGGTRNALTKEALLKLPFKISPQQNEIAKVLSDLDAKIELNYKINDNLEQMAKTLYDYWFVQFDFPDTNGKPYKTSGGKMIWNEELKREIPDGWEVKKIKEIAETGSGGTPLKSKKEYFEDGTIPWINSGEVNASFIISSRKFITKKGLDNSSAKLFKKGTILMAMYGATAGQVSLIDIEASTNQAVCGIIPNDKRMIPYLKYGLHQLYDYLINLSSGSARDNLSQDKIKELYFVIPEENLIEQFYKISNSHFEMILSNLKENQELASLRDWLLPMLMNGQVSVGEVEEELGMVAEERAEYNSLQK